MPIKIFWGAEIEADYRRLWRACKVNPTQVAACKMAANRILAGRARYEKLAQQTGVPWWFIGCLHSLEATNNFNKHLHNGDPLTGKTTHVPAGRPALEQKFTVDKDGHKIYIPYTFEESALDAIKFMGLDKVTDWSLFKALYKFEGFNGYGYRQYHPTVKSPYLWSFTNQYVKGKYESDGHFNPNLVSKQAGIAAIIKVMNIFDQDGKPIPIK